MTKPMRGTVLKWHGGKYYLSKYIVEIIPKHTRYLEAFGGGLSVLFRKDGEGISEYVNDLHGELSNFWYVLRDEDLFKRFKRMVEATPVSKEIFESTFKSDLPLRRSKIERAWAFFVQNRQSRQGLMKDYATPTSRTRRGMNETVSSWLGTVEGLDTVHERLKRVEIWNIPAIEAIRKLDSRKTLHYLDPPYVHATRNSVGEYEYEMTNQQHVELLTTIADIKGKFILSGYRHHLYDVVASENKWTRVDVERPNAASASKTKEIKTECIWTNFRIPKTKQPK